MNKRFSGLRFGLSAVLAGLSALAAPPTRFVRDNAPAGGDGMTWKSAYSNLQTAIDDLHAGGGGGQVWVKKGIYTPAGTPNPIDPGTSAARAYHYALRSNVEVYGGFAGDEEPATFKLADRDFIVNETILSADVLGDDADVDRDGYPDASTIDDNLCNLFWMPYNNRVAGAVLDGFTLTGGYDNEGNYNSGGAVVVEGSDVVFSNCIFRWNQAEGSGGAVLAGIGADSFVNCTFTYNRAVRGHGGAMVFNYKHKDGRLPNLNRCQFTGNTAAQYGGAVYCGASSTYNSAAPVVTACDFTANQAGLGGGAFAARLDIASKQDLAATIASSTFERNMALGDDGGAVHFSRDGGALTEMSLTVWNSTFHGNSTTGAGGGIFVFNGTFNVVNATFVDNLVDTDEDGDGAGGAFHGSAYSGLALNCIMWGNRRVGLGLDQVWGTQLDVQNSVVQDGWPDGTDNIDDDPLLDPAGLADNTGPTRTIALLGVSRALGHGIATGLPAGVDIANDQRGLPRNQARGIDAGAYQVLAELFTIQFTAGAGGTVDGLASRNFQVLGGASAGPCEAIPAPTHTFNRWTRGGALFSIVNPLTVPAVSENMTLVAEFAPKWRVQFVTDGTPGATLDGATDQYIKPGGDCTEVRAVPPGTHYFAGWTLAAVPFSMANPLTVTGVTDDMTLTANFLPFANVVFVAHDAAGTNDGSSWANAFVDLQNGIDQAAAIGGGGRGAPASVWVKAGTYTPKATPNGIPVSGMPPANAVHFALRNGVAVHGGFKGGEDPATFDLADRDFTAGETILSGDLNGDDALGADGFPDPATMGDNAYHVFYHPEANAVDLTAILDGFTIAGGYCPTSFNTGTGAGMTNVRSAPTVRHCVFRHNRNDSDNGGGAVGFRFGELEVASAGQFSDCRFEANHSWDLAGAVYLQGHSSTTIDAGFQRCHFIGNRTASGGGLYVESTSLYLTDCLFQNNTADYSGGALYAFSPPSLRIDRCTFVNNTGGENGGGCYLNRPTQIDIGNSTFADNTASGFYGGGIYIDRSSAAVNIWNSTFYGNSASGLGGGLYLSNSSSTTLVNLTIAGNTVTTADYSGAGLYSMSSDVSVYNSILWGNRVTSSSINKQLDGDFTLVTHSVVEGGRPSGVAIVTADPLLDPAGLADHGGPTQTIALLGVSPALGLGTTAAWPAAINIANDQRGLPRNQARGIDAGAYQVQSEVFNVDFVADIGGTVDGLPNRVVQVLPGQNAGPAEAWPAANRHFVRWMKGSAFYSIANPLTVFGVTENMELRAEFGVNPIVRFTTGIAGATFIGETVQQVPPGGDCTQVEAVPPATHYFTGWTKDGALFSDQNPVTVTGVAADMTLVAEFAPKWRVQFATDGTPGATLVGDTDQYVVPGGDCTQVEAVPPDTHHFVRWTTQAGSHFSAANPLKVTGVVADLALVAVFGPKFNVQFITDGTLGATLDGDTDQYVVPGGDCTQVKAVPPDTHYFVRWTDGGGFFSDQNPLTVTGVADNMILLAEFAAPSTIFVAADAAGSGSGFDWANAMTDLQGGIEKAAAIAAANTRSSVAVWVKAGLYRPSGTPNGLLGGVPPARALHFALRTGVAVYGGFAGTESPGSFDLATRDFVTRETILSGDLGGNDTDLDGDGFPDDATIGDNSCNLFYHPWGKEADATAILDGFTLTSGYDNLSDYRSGAAMFNGNSAPTVRHCRFVGNQASYGGAVMVRGNSGGGTFVDCQFVNNRATVGGGGAVVANSSVSPLSFDGCTFSGNRAVDGGGAVNMYQVASTVSFQTCRFATNVSDASGGAISMEGGSPRFSDCEFRNNEASYGGGLHAYSYGDLWLESCTFASNTAAAGSGGAGVFNSGVSTRIVNTTFHRNQARDYGGAMTSQNNAGAMMLVNVTLAENHVTTGWGGGIRNYAGTVGLVNCIAWGNTRTDANLPDQLYPDDSFAVDRSVVQGVPWSGWTNISTADPQLDPAGLGDHGGPTPTLALAVNSSALGLGTAVGLPAGVDVSADQRHLPRNQTRGIDAGAYQLQSEVRTVTFTAGTGGTVEGQASLAIHVLPGLDAGPVEAQAADTHYFVRWTKGGNLYSIANPLTVTNVTADMDLVAEFAVYETLYVAADASGDGSGRNWDNACTDLQVAIEKAAAIAALGRRTEPWVWVKAGTYKPSSLPNGTASGSTPERGVHFALRNGVAVFGGLAGTEDPDTFDLDTRDFIANETILSGDLADNDSDDDSDGFVDEPTNGENACHVFFHSDRNPVDDSAILDGFTVTGGYDNLSTYKAGGAMLNMGSSPTVRHCWFIGNQAFKGGAVAVMYDGGGGSFADCRFEGNRATQQEGGAFRAENIEAGLSFLRCDWVGNQAADNGGAFSASSGDAVIVEACRFIDNQASSGGGMLAVSISSLRLSGCEFTGGRVDGEGGAAMFVLFGGEVDIDSCTFADNQAGYGGAISVRDGTTARIVNATFHDNRANNVGGAIYTYGDGISVSLSHCTLVANRAGTGFAGIFGGGIARAQGEVSVVNSLLWGNTRGAELIPNQIDPAGAVAVDHCLVGSQTYPSWTNVIDADPGLHPDGLKNNGGPVRTLALVASSAAVDAGTSLPPTGSLPGTDARSVRRPQGGGCDLGAYEFESGPLTAIRLYNGWNCVAAPADDWAPDTVVAGLGLQLLGGPWLWQDGILVLSVPPNSLPAGTPVFMLIGGAPEGGTVYDFGSVAEFAPALPPAGAGWRLAGVGGNWPHYLTSLANPPISSAGFLWSAHDQILRVIGSGGALSPGTAAWLYQTGP